MTDEPIDDGWTDDEAWDEPPGGAEEAPPLDLWAAVGGVPPWGTALLLLAWGAVFTALALRGGMGEPSSSFAWGATATGLSPAETAWRLLASTFLHAGPAHLFFNAASMVVLGPAVERVFARASFWIVYAGGGAAASLGSLLWRASPLGPGHGFSVGASGAIYALGGAMLAAAFRLRRRLAVGRARALGAALLFLTLPGLAAGFTRMGTDNVAHAVGLACGVALGAALPLSARLGGGPGGPIVGALGAAGGLALALSLALGVRGGLGLG